MIMPTAPPTQQILIARRRSDLLGNRWVRFAARRISRLFLTLAGLVVVTFLMVPLIPGDPVRRAMGQGATPEEIEIRRHALGLDRPLYEQFFSYVGSLLQGNLGQTFRTREPVIDVLTQRIPASFALGLCAFIVAFVGALALGFTVAVLTRGGRRRWLEILFSGITSFVAMIPEFFVAILFLLVFAIQLHWFPVGGMSGPKSFVLPVLALAILPIFGLAKLSKEETEEVLTRDYVLTARSKYLSRRRILLRHVLPNMLTGSLTAGGFMLSALLVGSVFIEIVFNWPGIGPKSVSSIMEQDYPLMQALILYYGALVLIIMAVVDVLLTIINPRSLAMEA